VRLAEVRDRVQALIEERGAGKLSLRQFRRRISTFSNQELARLDAALQESYQLRSDSDPPRSRQKEKPSLLRALLKLGSEFTMNNVRQGSRLRPFRTEDTPGNQQNPDLYRC
jgi:hypothetical protein